MIEWHEKLVEKCNSHQIELTRDGSYKLLFLCAKIPSEELQRELIKELPSGFTFEFIECPKTRSIYHVKNLLGKYLTSMKIGHSFEILLEVDRNNQKLYIRTNASISNSSPFWDEMNKVLVQDGYFKGWRYKNTHTSEEHVFDIINPVPSNKPERDTIIKVEEITDLRIILNDPKMTWDKFMENV
jgi:hypothetical protein